MFLAGDEFGNSQYGNNNGYCQDNEISWLDWSLLEKNQDLFRFFKYMIAYRKRHPVIRKKLPDAVSGMKSLQRPMMRRPCRFLCRKTMTFAVSFAGYDREKGQDDIVYLAMNTYWKTWRSVFRLYRAVSGIWMSTPTAISIISIVTKKKKQRGSKELLSCGLVPLLSFLPENIKNRSTGWKREEEKGCIKFLMGNEAIALGALAAGVNLVSGYPGTPSTEVLETVAKRRSSEVYVEWSVNEKAALEVGAGAAYSGARVMVTMKQVGLNVAADPLMSLAYIGVKGGMVILVADDPGPISSQTEQDTRQFARFSKVSCFDPSSVQEAYEMIQEAFAYAEKYQTPVFSVQRPASVTVMQRWK